MSEYAPVLATVHDIERQYKARRAPSRSKKPTLQELLNADPEYRAYCAEIERPREWYEVPRKGFMPMRTQ